MERHKLRKPQGAQSQRATKGRLSKKEAWTHGAAPPNAAPRQAGTENRGRLEGVLIDWRRSYPDRMDATLMKLSQIKRREALRTMAK